MHFSPPLQLILIHCPSEIAAEMDALCRRNFMRRTDFMIMAVRSLLDNMERAAAEENERLRRQLLDRKEPVLFPGEFPEAHPGGESALYPEEATYPDEDDPLLYAAEEEE